MKSHPYDFQFPRPDRLGPPTPIFAAQASGRCRTSNLPEAEKCKPGEPKLVQEMSRTNLIYLIWGCKSKQ